MLNRVKVTKLISRSKLWLLYLVQKPFNTNCYCHLVVACSLIKVLFESSGGKGLWRPRVEGGNERVNRHCHWLVRPASMQETWRSTIKHSICILLSFMDNEGNPCLVSWHSWGGREKERKSVLYSEVKEHLALAVEPHSFHNPHPAIRAAVTSAE